MATTIFPQKIDTVTNKAVVNGMTLAVPHFSQGLVPSTHFLYEYNKLHTYQLRLLYVYSCTVQWMENAYKFMQFYQEPMHSARCD